ncbi:MAG: hypothetical protein ABI895_22920 [Deltaproteobacteria bacterium]
MIGTDGQVSSVHVDSQPFVELGKCGARVMRGLRFPAPAGGAVSVSYPLRVEGAAGSEPSSMAMSATPATAPPSHSGDLKAGRLAVSTATHKIPRRLIHQSFR